nr:hypothetical protein [Pararhizobium sp. IMCC3301]
MILGIASPGAAGLATASLEYELDARQKTADNALFLWLRGEII